MTSPCLIVPFKHCNSTCWRPGAGRQGTGHSRSLMVDQVCFLKDPDLEHMHCKIIVLPPYSLKAAFLHQGNLEYTLIDIKVTLFDTATIRPAAIRNIHICINILCTASLSGKIHKNKTTSCMYSMSVSRIHWGYVS